MDSKSQVLHFHMISTGTNYPGIPPERSVSPALLIAHELTHLLPRRLFNESQAINFINGARHALNLPVRHSHGSLFHYPDASAPNPGIYQWRLS
jgi:hypothetical protein